MRNLALLAIVATLTIADGRAQSRCTVATFVPEPLFAATPAEVYRGDESIAGAAKLLAEGRSAEARTQLAGLVAEPMSRPPDRLALAWSLRALAEATLGKTDDAKASATRAAWLASDSRPTAIASATQLNIGWAWTEIGDVGATRAALVAAQKAAQAAGDKRLEALALVHRALLEGRIDGDVETAARAATASLVGLDDHAARARLEVALGLALLPERADERFASRHALATDALAKAYADADAARDPAVLAQALGLMGEFQLLGGDSRGAATTLARASNISRAIAEDPWRFRWLWKEGVALRASGDRERGRARLGEAVEALESAKSRRALGRFSSSTLARDYRRAYLDFADATLADSAGEDALKRVRATLELSRTAEMEDFFRDPCLASHSARVAEPEALDESAAVIHPILLDDRVEILVSHRSGIARFTTPGSASAIAREVQRLRNALERPGSERYRQPAQRLYATLVAPIEAHLARLGVTTLVWVPDGALRGVPFAALLDGRHFLVERYAIAITPAATLTDPRPIGATVIHASLSGLTVPAQGFPALPGVARELDTLSEVLGVAPLRDERFTVAALEDRLRRSPVNTLHIASHGQFAPEAEHTFIVASDGRLTLDDLRAALSAGKLREEPLELIALSACQTAAGDDRAALGLAGVAIGAGARSALATLWAVADESTSLVTSAFYRDAISGRASRAQALRHAQLALLADRRFSHPFYWAPYVLIGNWM